MKYIAQHNLWWVVAGVMSFLLYWCYLGLFMGLSSLVEYGVPTIALVFWSGISAWMVTVISVRKFKEKQQS